MKTEIQERLEQNLARVEGLLALYQESGDGKGRRPVAATDLLRAAVVFLHATLEDVLRSSLEWKWPQADPEHFEGIAFAGGTATKVSLAGLVKHRERSVQDLVDEAVAEYLAQSNFNNLGQIKVALGRIGVEEAVLTPFAQNLQPMMSRRHHIVHRADRNELRGRGHHAALSLPEATVTAWRDAVKGFGEALLATL